MTYQMMHRLMTYHIMDCVMRYHTMDRVMREYLSRLPSKDVYATINPCLRDYQSLSHAYDSGRA